MTLAITGLYASLLAFVMIGLGYRVVRLRRKYRVGVLDGGHHELTQAIRIHGNATEWVPIVLILFACAESLQLSPWVLHGLGIVLVLSRILHIQGLRKSVGRSFGRYAGIVGTWTVATVLGCYNIYRFVMQAML
ncbi:MAG: MAPEG family protein [Gammaproteobacteria bacterium]|jgi:uncharacterized membrane protein YecN with MAPEG domain|nr:MAPEG family protein [Gammaproteobacteria bacterium]